MQVEQAVAFAKQILDNSPFDKVHDSTHHANVWENCQKIIQEETVEPNLDYLQIAAWWHDVDRDSEYPKTLDDTLLRLNFPDDAIQDIVRIVEEHTFGMKQTTLESKILYDADKLEYLRIERFQDLLGMSQHKIDYYLSSWRMRIKQVWKNLHFNASRQSFRERFLNLKKYAQDQDRLRSTFDNIEFDFEAGDYQ